MNVNRFIDNSNLVDDKEKERVTEEQLSQRIGHQELQNYVGAAETSEKLV